MMQSLFLAEKVAREVNSLISKFPGQAIEKKDLAAACEISDENATKNLATLRKLGLLDDAGKATPLGTRWARVSTCESATEEIIAVVFPAGMGCFPSDVSNEAAVPFLVEEGGIREEVAKKNAAVFRLLRQISFEANRECKIQASSNSARERALPPAAPSDSKMATFHVPANSSDELIMRLLRLAKEANVAIDIDMR